MIDQVLQSVSHVRGAKAAKGRELELAELHCDKVVFRYRDYRVYGWRDAERDLLFGFRNWPDVVPEPACLQRAVKEHEQLVPYAAAIIDKSRAQMGERWSDPDLGAANWVDCTPEQKPILGGTLLHELNHQLKRGSCTHEPASGDHWCFDFPAELPKRSLGVFSTIEGLGRVSTRVARAIESTYTGRNDAEFFLLLEELNASRIGCDVEAALIRRRASRRRPGAKGVRILHLPQMMHWTVHYALLLHKRDPDLHRRALGPGTENRERLLALLELCEASYRSWLEAVKSARGRPQESERVFWEEYQRVRAKWLATSAAP